MPPTQHLTSTSTSNTRWPHFSSQPCSPLLTPLTQNPRQANPLTLCQPHPPRHHSPPHHQKTITIPFHPPLVTLYPKYLILHRSLHMHLVILAPLPQPTCLQLPHPLPKLLPSCPPDPTLTLSTQSPLTRHPTCPAPTTAYYQARPHLRFIFISQIVILLRSPIPSWTRQCDVTDVSLIYVSLT